MSSDYRPVRVTPTHAGPDSKGIVSVFGWDLEGMVAFYLVGGAVAGMFLVFVLTGCPIFTRLGAAVIPVLASALWVKFFIHGRPPSYQSDVFDRWLRGTTFKLCPQRWCRKKHPRHVVFARMIEKEQYHG
jgi:hypothetical protein